MLSFDIKDAKITHKEIFNCKKYNLPLAIYIGHDIVKLSNMNQRIIKQL